MRSVARSYLVEVEVQALKLVRLAMGLPPAEEPALGRTRVAAVRLGLLGQGH